MAPRTDRNQAERRILALARAQGRISTREIAEMLAVSRQYAQILLRRLVAAGHLAQIGSTIHTFYVDPDYLRRHPSLMPSRVGRRLVNRNLEEHRILEDIEARLPRILKLHENIRSILAYAFSEMLNNAIEHSKSERIEVTVAVQGEKVIFTVVDFGVGVFRNVMRQRRLRSQVEAAQDLLKGKVTTKPHAHSGEGIFFTSRAADLFILESFGLRLIVNNVTKDVQLSRTSRRKRGTLVKFLLSTGSDRHLDHVFRRYTDVVEDRESYGFNKTEVKVRLYTMGGVHVSRSQARRILTNLERFESVVLDYDQVPMIGQAFADEIYRVFQNRHPKIRLTSANAHEAVRFMIERVKGNASRKRALFEDAA